MVYRTFSDQRVELGRRLFLPLLLLLLGLLFVVGYVRPFSTTPVEISSPYHFPLTFVPNAGQSDGVVRYQAHLSGANLFFTDEGLTLGWVSGEAAEAGGLRLNFLGANSTPVISGREAQAGRVNYMTGDNPDDWQTALPTYGVVTYEGLYPGVSAAFYGQGNQVAAVFEIQSDVDPAQIGWAFDWANPVLDVSGALQLVPEGAGAKTAVTLAPPQAWQEVEGQKTAVAAAYHLDENGRVGMTFGAYDAGKPLVVRSIMGYGSEDSRDIIRAIAIGPTGKVYVTGETAATIFPLENPYEDEHGNSWLDGFVTVFNPDGQTLVYSTFLGGDSDDGGHDIAVDGNDNAFVTGWTRSSNFPLENPIQSDYGGGYTDGFVTAFTPNGQLIYSTYLGGSDLDNRSAPAIAQDNRSEGGISLDNNGRAYVTGYTRSDDFPLVNEIQSNLDGIADVFVTIFAANGQSLEYSTYFGGSGGEVAYDIALDSSGRIFIVGRTGSVDFPVVNPFQFDYANGFVTILTADGQSIDYSTFLGGSSEEVLNAIEVGDDGAFYVTGFTKSSNFPLENPLQSTFRGNTDIVVTAFAPDGQSLLYSTYLGMGDWDRAYDISVDAEGRAYIVGETWSSNLPLVNPLMSFGGGDADAFAAVFAADGQSMKYGTFLGGNSKDGGLTVALDENGRLFIAGYTFSDDFPLVNPFQSSYVGGHDGFISVIAADWQSLDYSTYLNGAYPAVTSVGVTSLEQEATGDSLVLALFVLVVVGLIAVGVFGVVRRKRLSR